MRYLRPAEIFFGLLVCCLMIGALPSYAQEKGEEINALRAAEKEERRILGDLDELEKQISEIEDRLIPIEKEIDSTGEKLNRGDREIRSLGKSLEERKRYLARRLRAIYRLRDGGMLRVLLEAGSFQDMLNRYRYLTLILKQDEGLLRDYAEKTEALKQEQGDIRENRSRLDQLRLDIAAGKEKLEKKRLQKTALLMKVHQRKELYLKLLNTREDSRQKMIKEVIIAPRESGGTAAVPEKTGDDAREPVAWPDFAALKGKIPRPVDGRVTARFGRNPGPFDTVIIRHGLVFAAPDGVGVRAVLNGRVLHAGWLRGYGNIIIIDHGNRYYTLTGGISGQLHKPGDWVRQGDILGYAPKGGQADKKDIYFEIRHKGQALDPADWLGDKPVA